MRGTLSIALLVALAASLGACNREDVGGAEQQATEQSADQPLSPSALPVESGQPETAAETRQDVAMAREQAQDTRQQVDMASEVSKAEARHQVQVEKCEGLQGTARSECIAAADRELERIRERETAELERKQSQ